MKYSFRGVGPGRPSMGVKAERLQQGPDDTEARQRHGHGKTGQHEDRNREQWVNEPRKRGADQEHDTGNQPDRPFDVPAVRGDDVDTGSHDVDSVAVLIDKRRNESMRCEHLLSYTRL